MAGQGVARQAQSRFRKGRLFLLIAYHFPTIASVNPFHGIPFSLIIPIDNQTEAAPFARF
jgi:hypothetical protein